MTRPGIFNPYKPEPKKKRDRGSPIDMNSPYDTEYREPKETSNIALDGDTYVVEFMDAKLEDVPKRLGELLTDIVKTHREELEHWGIYLYPHTEIPSRAVEEMLLPTPHGTVGVYVGMENGEVSAYRRLGWALSRMRIADILERNRTRVYAR